MWPTILRAVNARRISNLMGALRNTFMIDSGHSHTSMLPTASSSTALHRPMGLLEREIVEFHKNIGDFGFFSNNACA